jgi:2-keto-4-pentenoate hydratase/2-oxohepta-3-ene-1,7-dioic acid hydratase in catechol pathway
VYSLPDIGVSYFNMNDLVARLTEEDRRVITEFLSAPDEEGIPYSEIVKCAPIPRPSQDVICLGENFRAHTKEAERYSNRAFGGEKKLPIYFSKRVGEAVADFGGIPAHADVTQKLDYESELAVIIGREAYKVAEKDAYDYIFGYTILNDISARDVQTGHRQWYLGKSLDGFTPIGPWIVTADEIPGRPCLQVKSYVNGILRQNGNTDDFIFDIPYCIAELSQGMKLLPGTIISMGTPAGVGMGFDPPRFLSVGDTVDCEIEGIGTLHNMIVE